MRVKGWQLVKPFPVYRRQRPKPHRKPKPPSFPRLPDDSVFDSRLRYITTTTVYLLRPPPSLSPTPPPLILAADSSSPLQFYHPLIPKRRLCNLPHDFDLSKFRRRHLAVSYRTNAHFDKLLVLPPPKSPNPNFDDHTLLALYNGGQLTGCLPGKCTGNDENEEEVWMHVSGGSGSGEFDDITTLNDKIYAVDRAGLLYVVTCNYVEPGKITIGKPVINQPVTPGVGRFRWRKRFVVDGNQLFLVVRRNEELFRVYKRGKKDKWDEVEGFEDGKVLFMSRDYYFLIRAEKEFPGREYRNCIVFSEAGFPQYGKDCWKLTQTAKSEDDIAVFRLDDEVFARESKNGIFPEISWFLRDWIHHALPESAAEVQSRSSSESSSKSKSEPDDDEGLGTNSREEVQSDLKESNSKGEKDGEMESDLIGQGKEQDEMDSDPVNQGKEDEKMQSDSICQGKEQEEKESDPASQGKEKEKMQSDSICQGKKQEEMASDPASHGKEDEKMQSDAICQGKEQEEMESDPVSQGKEDGKMQSDSDSPIVFKLRRKRRHSAESRVELPFKFRRNFHLNVTTVYLLNSPCGIPLSTPPSIIAGINSGAKLELYHPLTSKRHLCSLPENFDLSRFNPTTLAMSYHMTAPFHKVWVFPSPKLPNPNYDNHTLLTLYNGGELGGCLPTAKEEEEHDAWVKVTRYHSVCSNKFDDIAIVRGKVYTLDREGNLFVVTITRIDSYTNTPGRISVGDILINHPFNPGLGRWRKRLVIDRDQLYMVVRTEEKLIQVYKRGKGKNWDEVGGFGGDQVLFMGRDYYFYMQETIRFQGREFRDCIVFAEGAFPRCGEDCWEFTQSADDITIFRFSEQAFARDGENEFFPKLNWSPPDWIFSSDSQSVREPEEVEGLDSNCRDENDGKVLSDLKDSNSKDVEMQSDLICQDKQEEMDSDSDRQDQEDVKMQCVSDSQEEENDELLSNANMEGGASLQVDVLPSLFGPEVQTTDIPMPSICAADVTRTLLRINGGSVATDQETPRKNIRESVPRACTSSASKRHKSVSATTRFERFDIRSDLVPTLQKIWRKHGNIVEHSTMRSVDILAGALESLATIVRLLEDNSAWSLSDSQAGYLSSTLSDLKCMSFKVQWLIPFVEKAVKLHKSKPLLDSLNNLSRLSSQVKERRAVIFEELAKPRKEENKLKEEMVKVSKMIPLPGHVKFDEPLGLELT